MAYFPGFGYANQCPVLQQMRNINCRRHGECGLDISYCSVTTLQVSSLVTFEFIV